MTKPMVMPTVHPPGSLIPDLYEVTQVTQETEDTFTLAIAAKNGDAFSFTPGQFNMLYAYGAGESAISISGDPDQVGTPLLHTIRRVGTVTSKLATLQPGDTLGVRGPYGVGWPMAEAAGKDLLFIAGGIGIAPLRPAIYHALNNPDAYGKVRVLIGARHPSDLLYMSELAGWAVETLVTVDHAQENWHGHVGVVTPYISKLGIAPDNTVAMICGPEIMMRYAALELKQCAVPDEQIYLTMERNMKCAVGFCGHCQLGPEFICKDGPVFAYDKLRFWFDQREF